MIKAVFPVFWDHCCKEEKSQEDKMTHTHIPLWLKFPSLFLPLTKKEDTDQGALHEGSQMPTLLFFTFRKNHLLLAKTSPLVTIIPWFVMWASLLRSPGLVLSRSDGSHFQIMSSHTNKEKGNSCLAYVTQEMTEKRREECNPSPGPSALSQPPICTWKKRPIPNT